MPRSFDAPPSIQDVQPKRFIPYPEDAGAAPDAATRSAPAAAPPRPTLAFMLRHPAHWLGLGFGSGLSPIAPGTAGTLWAWGVPRRFVWNLTARIHRSGARWGLWATRQSELSTNPPGGAFC